MLLVLGLTLELRKGVQQKRTCFVATGVGLEVFSATGYFSIKGITG